MKKIIALAIAVSMIGVVAKPSSAQDGESSTDMSFSTTTTTQSSGGWNYATRYTDRPLTMQKHMVRATGNLYFADSVIPNKVNSGLTLGGSFAVLDDVEVGISNYRTAAPSPFNDHGLLPIIFSPSGDFGDIPLYGRYRFLNTDKFEAAADLVLLIPSNTQFAIAAGVPVRIRVIDNAVIDTGIEIIGILENPKAAVITLPGKITFNITDEFFVGGETGFVFLDLSKSGEKGFSIPLFVRGGYTLRKAKQLYDFFAHFGWSSFIEAGTNRKTLNGASWEIVFGVNVHTDPLF